MKFSSCPRAQIQVAVRRLWRRLLQRGDDEARVVPQRHRFRLNHHPECFGPTRSAVVDQLANPGSGEKPFIRPTGVFAAGPMQRALSLRTGSVESVRVRLPGSPKRKSRCASYAFKAINSALAKCTLLRSTMCASGQARRNRRSTRLRRAAFSWQVEALAGAQRGGDKLARYPPRRGTRAGSNGASPIFRET